MCRPICLSVKNQLACMLVVTCCTGMNASSQEVYVSADGFAHSESKAVKSITGNWDGDLHSGEIAFSVDRAEVGIVMGDWRIGYLSRYDYYWPDYFGEKCKYW